MRKCIPLLILAASLVATAAYAQVYISILGNVVPQSNVMRFGAISQGVKFNSSADGHVVAVRFYRSADDTGPNHTVRIYTLDGSMLAEAVAPEDATGWQETFFTTPVTITAGVNYMASVYSPDGWHYADDSPGVGLSNGPLRFLNNNESGCNPCYDFINGMPNSQFATNMWIDILFSQDTPIATATATATNTVTPSPDASATQTATSTVAPSVTATAMSLPTITAIAAVSLDFTDITTNTELLLQDVVDTGTVENNNHLLVWSFIGIIVGFFVLRFITGLIWKARRTPNIDD